MNKVSKFLFVLGILSFLVIFALKMQNNMEAEQYYSEKVTDAQNRLDTLNEANGQEEENQSAIIFKAAKITETTGIFSEWCSENLETRADQCLSVFEDYVNSNDHIVTQINELMSSSNN